MLGGVWELNFNEFCCQVVDCIILLMQIWFVDCSCIDAIDLQVSARNF